MTIPVTITQDAISLILSGKPYVIPMTNKLVHQILDAVKADDRDAVADLVDKAKGLEKHTSGAVTVVDGRVLYKGWPLNNAVVPKLLQMFEQGYDVTPWVSFVEKLMENPSFSSREQLYRFIEANQVPIDEDGDMVLYKWVRSNYYDTHSGTIFNGVGAVVEMERASVDDDPNRTCSAGLHVCSQGYTKFGERLMYIKVSPKDVVSVPTDYNNSKMRVSKYVVLSEEDDIAQYDTADWTNTPVYGESEDYEDELDDDEEFWASIGFDDGYWGEE